MAKIKVASQQTSDPSSPRVSSEFEHEIPESLTEAIARFTESAVYELFKGAYTVAIQSPARKELLAQWESMSETERAELIVLPESGEGVATALLPAAQQTALQERMNAWQLGEKAPRARVAKTPADKLQDFLDILPSLDEDRRAEIQGKVAELLGMNTTGGRRR